MPISNEFNTELLKQIGRVIPCVHISNSLIADRVLLGFRKYLNDCLENGFTSIDQVLEDMKIKDDQPRQ